MSILTRAMLLGLATGGRSSLGLAALAATAERDAGSVLSSRWSARLAGLVAAAELIGDKLPQAPSRLEPRGLIPRLGLGVVGAAMLAHREGNSRSRTVLAAGLGLAGAAAGSRLGARWRTEATAKFGSRLPPAVLEDLVCLSTAGYATRGR